MTVKDDDPTEELLQTILLMLKLAAALFAALDLLLLIGATMS